MNLVRGQDNDMSIYRRDYLKWPFIKQSASANALAANFSHAQDEQMSAGQQVSVTHKDFPGKLVPRTQPIRPSQPADIMMLDERLPRQPVSETREQYIERNIERDRMVDVNLRDTTFKNHGDSAKFNAFETSYRNNFTPKSAELPNTLSSPDKFTSQLTIGDVFSHHQQSENDKRISEFRSEYRDFGGHGDRFEQVQSGNQKSNEIFKGENRQHEYATNHRQDYLPKISRKTSARPKNLQESHIPMGDPIRDGAKNSEHQTEFIKHELDPNHLVGLSQRNKFQKTQVTQADSQCDPSHFKSTHKLDFEPKSAVRAERAAIDMNVSSIPQGDTDPRRIRAAASSTTYNVAYLDKPYSKRAPAKTDSEATQSEVVFGNDDEAHKFFQTTQRSDFKPNGGFVERAKPRFSSWQSDVPMKPDFGYVGATTVQTDYIDHGKVEELPESTNLTKTNFKMPISEQEYSTTYRSHYVPKETDRRVTDAQDSYYKLQRSHVPIGTLAI